MSMTGHLFGLNCSGARSSSTARGVIGIEPLLSVPRSLAAALSSWMSERVYRLLSNRITYLDIVSALTVRSTRPLETPSDRGDQPRP